MALSYLNYSLQTHNFSVRVNGFCAIFKVQILVGVEDIFKLEFIDIF